MNAVSKAIATLQAAPVGVPVGRYSHQIKVLVEFVESVAAMQAKNAELRVQLLEAHERFGKLLGGEGSQDKLDAEVTKPVTPFPPVPPIPDGYKFSEKSRINKDNFVYWLSVGWTIPTLITNDHLVRI